MITVVTNIPQAQKNRQLTLFKLTHRAELERRIAFAIIAMVSKRVQQYGLGSNDQPLTGKSSKKTGAYSYAYGKKRQNQGRQIAHIDLTFTGDMFRPVIGFWFELVNGEINIGFVSKAEADKAEWNEAKYGKIWQLTDKEKEVVLQIIAKWTREKLA